ncbi:hypothetical protein F442_03743 [Phytophthora nicotianae P10297]|uniref:Uncharacterized protein n=3 Tax=Phytophthora nicotianae TaxID=4792 RepID=V9FP63_PHYNI|nr:hypothetical protein F443_03762 [Phytophthora nicotianae P1569]ETP51047.1 hypothetical protein F442_03743 [Phytophthora nicotianae P10297]
MDLGPDPTRLDHEGIIRFLLERMTDGKLPRGCINDAAAYFSCTRQTEVLKAVPAIERTSYRALAVATGIPTFHNQPPRSPDFNELDLGFFSSIQASQYQERAYNMEQLVDAVESALVELESVTLSK